MEDHKLIRLIINGDKDAFEQLVRKHYQNIYSYCYRRVWDENTAADLTQEVFLKLVVSIYGYRFSGKFVNFLFTIAVNTCNDYFRKRGPATECELTDSVPSKSTPTQSVEEQEANRLLLQRLDTLPENQRQAILLVYFHGFKARDVARITGVPLATAKSRIRQGLQKLRKLYEEGDQS